jgi:hypothetical protein
MRFYLWLACARTPYFLCCAKKILRRAPRPRSGQAGKSGAQGALSFGYFSLGAQRKVSIKSKGFKKKLSSRYPLKFLKPLRFRADLQPSVDFPRVCSYQEVLKIRPFRAVASRRAGRQIINESEHR